MSVPLTVEQKEKVDSLRKQVRGRNRAALGQVANLTVNEKQALFAEWVDLARGPHSPFNVAWHVIESLPRDWVLQNIEKEVDEILRTEEETDYWMFLQLYARLDDSLMKKLAARAASHPDADIRELGEEYLQK